MNEDKEQKPQKLSMLLKIVVAIIIIITIYERQKLNRPRYKILYSGFLKWNASARF